MSGEPVPLVGKWITASAGRGGNGLMNELWENVILAATILANHGRILVFALIVPVGMEPVVLVMKSGIALRIVDIAVMGFVV